MEVTVENAELVKLHEDEAETAVENAEPVKLYIEDPDGLSYLRVFNGTLLVGSREVEVYRTDDERFVVYYPEGFELNVCDDPEDLKDLLDFDAYVGVMNELGITPEVDLD